MKNKFSCLWVCALCAGFLAALSFPATAQLWEATPNNEMDDILESILLRETSPKITFVVKAYGKSGEVYCQQKQQYTRKNNILIGTVKGCLMIEDKQKEVYTVYNGIILKTGEKEDSVSTDTTWKMFRVTQKAGDKIVFNRAVQMDEKNRISKEEIYSITVPEPHSIMRETLFRKISYTYLDSADVKLSEDYMLSEDSLIFLGNTKLVRHYICDGKTRLLEKRTLSYTSIYEQNIPSITYFIQYFYDPQGRITQLTATGSAGRYSTVIEISYK